jgi:hypothetical protein
MLAVRSQKSRKLTKYKLVLKDNCLSGGSPKNHPMKKIDFFKSTSHVDFLKAHIKITREKKIDN